MELKTKKATPITDLMAYHLSQLCDEMGAGRPLESGLAGSVERALQDTEKLNSLERHSNPGTLARIANKTTESLASGAASRLSVEYTAAWEGVVDSLLADFGFVWDGSDEVLGSFKETLFRTRLAPLVSAAASDFENGILAILEPILQSHFLAEIPLIETFIKDSANETLANRLQSLTDTVKSLKSSSNKTPISVSPSKAASVPPPQMAPRPPPRQTEKPAETTSTIPESKSPVPSSVSIPQREASLVSHKALPPSSSMAQPTAVAQPPVPAPRSLPQQPPPPVEAATPPPGAKEEKKGVFGFKMLSHLTKARPKVKRGTESKRAGESGPIEVTDDANDSVESFKTTDTAQIEEPEEPVVNPTQVTTVAPQEPSPIYPRPPTMSEYGELSHATEQTGLDESEEIMAKRPEPTQAMSALASVMMRSGQRKSVHVPDSVDVESADDGISGSPSKVSVKSHSSSPAQQHPPESLSASSVKPAPAPRPRPAAPKTDGERNSADMSETQNPEPKATPPLAAKPSPPKKPFKHEQALAETVDTQQPPVPVPRPRPVVATRPNSDGAALVGSQRSPVSMETRRPMSMALEGSMADSGLPIAMYSPTRPDAPEIPATAPVPQPRRIPGVFSTQHGAIGALAAAVTGRKTSPASSPASEGLPSLEAIESSGLREPLGHDDEAADNQDDTVERAAELSSPRMTTRNFPIVSQTPMYFKKKDASVSGDDKAIEKSALDWLNQHLASKDIHIDDLYSSLGDGLNLIYALEDATGESVGKYSKRTVLPVHKIDNISVALNFLAKKGVDVHFTNPQDLMDGSNKGKILTLFNYVTKAFP